MKTVGANGFDKGKALTRTGFCHDAIIDAILLNPRIKQIDLAETFGYSRGWISRMLASDSFQARMAQRRNELVKPRLQAALNERIQSTLIRASDTLLKRMDAKDNADVALEALGLVTKLTVAENKHPNNWLKNKMEAKNGVKK